MPSNGVEIESLYSKKKKKSLKISSIAFAHSRNQPLLCSLILTLENTPTPIKKGENFPPHNYILKQSVQ